MNYYIDTEFIEAFTKPFMGKKRHFIDLISIGIVSETGRLYYAVSNEFDPELADPWVNRNVLAPMVEEWTTTMKPVSIKWKAGDMTVKKVCYGILLMQKHIGKSNSDIAQDIKEFIDRGQSSPILSAEPINFYGYYADYDWVLLCSLYGRMLDLPQGWPMYCKDLKQELDNLIYVHDPVTVMNISFDQALVKLKNHPDYPKQSNAHNALDDARWNRDLHKFIITV